MAGIVVFCGSGAAEHRLLSNLCRAPFTIEWPAAEPWVPAHMRGRAMAYSSSEAAYMSLRALDRATADAFCVGGRVDGLDLLAAPFPVVKNKSKGTYALKDLSAKARYWGARGCPGAAAKMVGSLPPSVAQDALGLALGPAPRCLDMWLPILHAKFSQRPHRARHLLETGDRVLVERGRFRQRAQFWSAFVDKGTGEIIGHNMMGRLLMRARAALLPPLEKQ